MAKVAVCFQAWLWIIMGGSFFECTRLLFKWPWETWIASI